MSVLRSIEACGVVAYKVAYARMPGCTPTVAIFLSQVAYWSARSEDGWCWITHDKLEEQTALSRDQQDRCAKILIDLGVLEKSLKGLPAKIHYRVDFDMLASKVAENHQAVMRETRKHTIEKITEDISTGAVAAEPQSAGTSTAVTEPALTSPEAGSSEERIAPRRARRSPPPSSAAPPPTQEELSAYMKETWPWIPALEYEKCHAHHQSRGWVDPKGKPWKDWKAVAKTWATNWKSFNQDKYMEIQRFEQSKARSEQQRAQPDSF